MTQPLADIGLIGLAVMGENFALNMESKGFRAHRPNWSRRYSGRARS
jgi:6-phosphogluconate dehydrogenase